MIELIKSNARNNETIASFSVDISKRTDEIDANHGVGLAVMLGIYMNIMEYGHLLRYRY